MSNFTSVVGAIKSIAQGVVGNTGVVYDQFVSMRNTTQFADKATVNGKINVFWFIQVPRIIDKTGESFLEETVKRKFILVWNYQYDLATKTDLIFGELLESLANAFNGNETLNGTVTTHNKLDIFFNRVALCGNVEAHLAMMEIETEEQNDL